MINNTKIQESCFSPLFVFLHTVSLALHIWILKTQYDNTNPTPNIFGSHCHPTDWDIYHLDLTFNREAPLSP